MSLWIDESLVLRAVNGLTRIKDATTLLQSGLRRCCLQRAGEFLFLKVATGSEANCFRQVPSTSSIGSSIDGRFSGTLVFGFGRKYR